MFVGDEGVALVAAGFGAGDDELFDFAEAGEQADDFVCLGNPV